MTPKQPELGLDLAGDALIDAADRREAITTRAANVVIVAGAGTGKTGLLVERILELVAPAHAAAPVPLERLAAVTFTRRAAGELRYRLHTALSTELARPASGRDQAALQRAVAQLDGAAIGTIHSLAERLLRQRPVEARLVPDYQLVEDTEELIQETLDRLLHGAQTGTLRTHLGHAGDQVAPATIQAAEATLATLERGPVTTPRRVFPWGPQATTWEFVRAQVESRDVDCTIQPPVPVDTVALEGAIRQLKKLAKTVGPDGREGDRWAQRTVDELATVATAPFDEPAYHRLLHSRARDRLRLQHDFGCTAAKQIYKVMRQKPPREAELIDIHRALRQPLSAFAGHLAALRPVILAVYEQVKDDAGVIDHVDLLDKLRHVQRDHPTARAELQAQFDQILVDEFQDTDPLQIEVLFFLCEAGHAAQRWQDVALQPGKLTVVGDPYQSIYRFRRADTALYAEAVDQLRRQGAQVYNLRTNFRSRPALIETLNPALAELLDIDNTTHLPIGLPLVPAPNHPPGAGPAVHIVPYRGDAGTDLNTAKHGRSIEGQALGAYLRWLLSRSNLQIQDPSTGAIRPVAPADIAVLASVTTEVPSLLGVLDAAGIAYNARGGRLYWSHPFVRRALLALSALIDPQDGVARLALFGPPFAALDLSHHFRAARGDATALGDVETWAAALSARAARQSPGRTLRDLIETSALGRTIALEPNGAPILRVLYQLAAELDAWTQSSGLSFAGAALKLRSWADRPPPYDAPEPMNDGCIQVMSIHQAKGLEFPVVVLWDGFATAESRDATPWLVARSDRKWSLNLPPFSTTSDPPIDLAGRERRERARERRRLYYVAATRARDLLALPSPIGKSRGAPPPNATPRLTYLTQALAHWCSTHGHRHVQTLDTFAPDAPPTWATAAAIDQPRARSSAGWTDEREALTEAAAKLPSPPVITTVTQLADTPTPPPVPDGNDLVAAAGFGPAFGRVVHEALATLATGADRRSIDVVRQTATLDHGLTQAAAEDVDRALDALTGAGLHQHPAISEQPVTWTLDNGTIVNGKIDLVIDTPERVVLIDYKTERSLTIPPIAAGHRRQLELYRDAVAATGVAGRRSIVAGILHTATGRLAWLD